MEDSRNAKLRSVEAALQECADALDALGVSLIVAHLASVIDMVREISISEATSADLD